MKDGTEKSIGYTAAPIHDPNGEVVGVALVFRDITERRLQEQLLKDTLNYAEAILATLREPFIVLDQKPGNQNGESKFLTPAQSAVREKSALSSRITKTSPSDARTLAKKLNGSSNSSPVSWARGIEASIRLIGYDARLGRDPSATPPKILQEAGNHQPYSSPPNNFRSATR